MPDDIKEGLDASQETPKEPATITADERAELETLRKQTELYKSDLSGKDKKLTELQKEVKARMSAEEQAKMQAEEERKEWLSDIAQTKAQALSLDEKHSALIKGNSKDEINAAAELVKSFKDSVVKEYEKKIKTLEEELNILKANGSAPVKGIATGTKVITEAQFKAMNPRDHMTFFNDGGRIEG
jgi:chromosome segregation ATPase